MESLLASFLVFDSIPPSAEGSDPAIYWYYSPTPRTKFDELNEAGLLITFIRFTVRFDESTGCDYVKTSKHEYAMLELLDNIWMAVALKSRSTTNRCFLHSILEYCRMLFSCFWVPLPKLNPGCQKPDLKVAISHIPEAFPFIINAIDWTRLDSTYLFNSCLIQPIPFDQKEELARLCSNLLNQHPNVFDNIAILYHKKKTIFSTFSPIITKALSFSMKKKFKHLFLHNPTMLPSGFSWIIGLYINNSGLSSIYQPCMFYDGKLHYLIAFRYNDYKIVLSQPDSIDDDEVVMKAIPKFLAPIRQFLSHLFIPTLNDSVPIPFAISTNHLEKNHLIFHSKHIDAASRPIVDENVIILYNFMMTSYSGLKRCSFPVNNSFSVLAKKDSRVEYVVFFQSDEKLLSQRSKIANIIIGSTKGKNVETPKRSLCIVY